MSSQAQLTQLLLGYISAAVALLRWGSRLGSPKDLGHQWYFLHLLLNSCEKPGAPEPRPQTSVQKHLLRPMALHGRNVDTGPPAPQVCWAVAEEKRDPPGCRLDGSEAPAKNHLWFCPWAGSLGKTGEFLLLQGA